jgi:hypothetical protein
MERFLSKVEVTDGCWKWKAGSRGNGYGAFRMDNKVVDAHRVSYLLFKGEIPDGLVICHSCDNRNCVNPDHLSLGTYKENYWDARNKGRIFPMAKTGVKKHPSHSAYRQGCRCSECKELTSIRMAEYRMRLKAA